MSEVFVMTDVGNIIKSVLKVDLSECESMDKRYIQSIRYLKAYILDMKFLKCIIITFIISTTN